MAFIFDPIGSGGNTIIGTEDSDDIFGNDGDDTIDGAGGTDYIRGGEGEDTIIAERYTGSTGDLVFYDDDPSAIYVDLQDGYALDGWGDLDTLINVGWVRGSDFDDTLLGTDAFFDFFDGGPGDDYIDGRAGGAYVWYGRATQAVFVDLEAGFATGQGNDTLVNITAIGGSNFGDTLLGDSNDNFFIPDWEGDPFTPNSEVGGDDYVDGRDGFDSVSYSRAVSSVYINLDQETATDGHGNTDTLISIEAAAGSQFDDEIIGSTVDNRLAGGGGRDMISGLAGNDTIFGDGGQDVLYGHEGNDEIFGGADADDMFGDEGNDILFGDGGNDRLFGGQGKDKIDGGEGVDWVYYDYTTSGVEVYLGQIIDIGPPGSNNYKILNKGYSVEDGRRSDVISNIEKISGTPFDDVLWGNDEDNHIIGWHGNDDIRGFGGEDTVTGGDGDDALDGGSDDDLLIGGLGADMMTGGDGSDEFIFASRDLGEADQVTDYEAGIDVIIINDNETILSGENIYLEDTPDGVLVSAGASADNAIDFVLLQGVDAADVNVDDFVFV